MAFIDRDRRPSPSELRWFGALLGALIAFFGTTSYLKGRLAAAVVLWGLAVLLASVYYGVRPLRRPMYRAWMTLIFPVGWVVSHLVLGIAYYLVVTPVGFILRAVGYDPMGRRFDPAAKTYWSERRRAASVSRYFRQF